MTGYCAHCGEQVCKDDEMSEALRLADELSQAWHSPKAQTKAAAELRRLDELEKHHKEINVRLHIDIERLQAVNKELLEALKLCDEAMTWELGGEPLDTAMQSAREKARAAIEAKLKEKNL